MSYSDALPSGTELAGDYRIEDILGAGGFGITYRAADLRLNADVAIKEYFPGEFAVREETQRVTSRAETRDDDYQWGLKSFLNEAQTLARFRHPNIVRVARVFEDNNTAYMVLDLERGRSFGDWLKELSRLPTQNELDELLAPLLDALETIHANKFLHRDIAPDNFYVRDNSSPVLLDFGSARQAIGAHSQTLSAVIKSGYSPVEQYSSSSKQGPWTDIYALGATLYKAITGQAPQESTARLLEDEVKPAADIEDNDYRPEFLAAIDAALHPRPDDRPRSVEEWRGTLLGKSDRNAVTQTDTISPAHDAKTAIAEPGKNELAPDRHAPEGEREKPHTAPDMPSFWHSWKLTFLHFGIFLFLFSVTAAAGGNADGTRAIADIYGFVLIGLAIWTNLRFLIRKNHDVLLALRNMQSTNARLMATAIFLVVATVVYRNNETDLLPGVFFFGGGGLIMMFLSRRLLNEKARFSRIIFAGLCLISAPLLILIGYAPYWDGGLKQAALPALGAISLLILVSLLVAQRRRKRAENS